MTDKKKPDLKVVPIISKVTGMATTKRSAIKRSTKRTRGTSKQPLTDKQEIFAQEVAHGHNLASAYRIAYDTENMAPQTISKNAQFERKKNHVATRIEEILIEIDANNSTQQETRQQRIIATLEQMMIEAKTDTGKLRAAELLGKTVGLFGKDGKQAQNSKKTVAELEQELTAKLKQAGE